MQRSESNERLTPQSSPDRHYDAMGEHGPPTVEIRGNSNRRPVADPNADGTTAPNEAPIDPDRLLVYGSKQIIRLFVPVSICMLFVVVISSTIAFYTRLDTYLVYTPFHSENADTGQKLWESLSNALIFIGLLIVVTILLVVLYKYQCLKILYGWLVFTCIVLLFFFCFIFFKTICNTMNVFVDFITFLLFIWNLGIVGMLALFWKAPLIVQQGVLLLISSQMALFFIKYFPDWTTWFLLGLLAVWDLIAVLCPKGPLRILVEIAEERQDTLMPAMIYSTTAAMMADVDRRPSGSPNSSANSRTGLTTNEGSPAVISVNDAVDQPQGDVEDDEEGGFRSHTQNEERAQRLRLNESLTDSEGQMVSSTRARSAVNALNGDEHRDGDNQPSRTARNLRDIQEEVFSREDRGVKLGLGDFVFYSVLVGKASKSNDWNTILACYVAILIGMCFTLLLLAIRGHALPALPISIFFGLVFYFCTSLLITPFADVMAQNQVFV